MSKASHGTIDVELNGETYQLKPTLAAYERIEKHFGGLRGAIETLGQFNLESLCVLVCAGAGLGARSMPDIKDAVFNQGIADVTEQVTPFVTALFNPSGETEDADEGK